jgi:hypothetical protein
MHACGSQRRRIITITYALVPDETLMPDGTLMALLYRHSSGLGLIALGSYHTCVIVASGGLKCWGNNGNGQLGIGDTSARYSPVDVGLGAGMGFNMAHT